MKSEIPWWATGAVALSLLGGGCNKDDAQAHHKAQAQLHEPSGEDAGTVTLEQTDQGVVLTVDVHGLPPGEHALHVHEKGSCDPPDFKSAGGHFNPSGEGHGKADPDGTHEGDMVNLVVDDEGHGKARRVLARATLAAGKDADSWSLLRDGGTAVVIHAKPDDYRTDPAGAAGPRIACGVIEAES